MPKMRRFTLTLACCYFDLGEKGKALKAMKFALELSPNFIEAQNFLKQQFPTEISPSRHPEAGGVLRLLPRTDVESQNLLPLPSFFFSPPFWKNQTLSGDHPHPLRPAVPPPTAFPVPVGPAPKLVKSAKPAGWQLHTPSLAFGQGLESPCIFPGETLKYEEEIYYLHQEG